MSAVARVTTTSNHWSLKLALGFAMCLPSSAFNRAAAAPASPNEITLRLELAKTTVGKGEPIRLRLVFVGGADDTTLILPMGADPSGIITCRAIEIATGREWPGADRDPRSFAADARKRLPAGGRIELHRDALAFENPDSPIPGGLPVGKYRIGCTYDEGRTFSPKNRSSRTVSSRPVEITVTAR